MRKRLNYTPNQITNNLYTFGKEWTTVDNVEYIGPYHTYTTGETFTESTWNPDKSKKLIAYIEETDAKKVYKQLKTLQTSTQSPTPYFPIPTVEDRVAGYITRYFIKKCNDLNIIEIDSNQYTDWTIGRIDNNLYTAVQIKWWITGDIINRTENSVVIYGVTFKNKTAVLQADETMPGIREKLTNYTAYYTDTEFNAPADIN